MEELYVLDVGLLEAHVERLAELTGSIHRDDFEEPIVRLGSDESALRVDLSDQPVLARPADAGREVAHRARDDGSGGLVVREHAEHEPFGGDVQQLAFLALRFVEPEDGDAPVQWDVVHGLQAVWGEHVDLDPRALTAEMIDGGLWEGGREGEKGVREDRALFCNCCL